MLQLSAALLAVVPVVLCLYEDQVGNYDWHLKYVGEVSYISIDPSAKSTRGVVVASETGVLAVLDPHYGDIRWRQLFEPASNGYLDAVLRSKYGSLLTVSRHGQLLRSWDLSSGQLRYEVPTSLPPPLYPSPAPLHQTWRPGGVHAALAGKKGGVAVVGSGSLVVGFVGRSGEQKWKLPLKSEDNVLCGVYGQRDGVYVMTAVQSKEMEIIHLNSSNGEVISSWLIPAPWILQDSVNCMLSGDSMWCVDWADMQLYSARLTTDTPSLQPHPLHTLLPADTPTPLTLSPSHSPEEEVWLRAGHRYWLVGVGSREAELRSTIEVGVALVGACDVSAGSEGTVLDVRLEQGDKRQLQLAYYRDGSRKVGGVYFVEEDRGQPVQASVQLYTKSDQSVVFHVVVVMEDNSIIMFGSDKRSEWAREDGLGTISTVQFLDLPADQSAMVEDFLVKTKAELNPIKLALLRWQLQAQLLKEFIENVQQGPIATLLSDDSSRLVRDQFNTRKMILAVTAKSKVYGLDSSDGGVVWQQFIPWLRPMKAGSPIILYLLRSTSHPLHPPLAVLIGRSKHPSCYGVALVAFNPLTGVRESAEPSLCLGDVVQTFLLSKEDRNHSKILLLLTRDMEVVSYPSSVEVTKHVSELEEQLFFFVAHKESGEIDGYYINNERSPSSDLVTFHTSHLWHISFPKEVERIVSVNSKPANEHVSAMGRSRLDRSIQYKYLNPNLVAVATESTDPLRPAMSVYLLDAVTGSVIFHTTHKAAVPPLHLVHSENWIVYQLLNSKLRRHELVVVELFERDSNQTRTVWSSLTPPPPPEILTQAYAIPTSFVTMTTTQTRRGITSKAILVGLKSGHLAALPKVFLDPRREVEATDEMKEVGLPPYKPELNISAQLYLNYNQTVGALRNIYSTPSGLESTSLVLACGLDLYFTRVLPSKQFDLLAVDFDYNLIAGVVVSMVAATFILSKLSARKSLKLLWK